MRFKKIILYFIFFILLINLASLILIQFKFNENVYNFSSYIKKKKSLIVGSLPGIYIHPFFGKIFLNNKKLENNYLTDEYLVNDVYRHESEKNDKGLKILILGGSIAKNLTNNTKNEGNSLFNRSWCQELS